MKRAIAVLFVCWLTAVAAGSVHTYGDITTLNAGIWWYVPLTTHWCGYEYRGNPGFFCDVT